LAPVAIRAKLNNEGEPVCVMGQIKQEEEILRLCRHNRVIESFPDLPTSRP
jgi:hypothetical protein